MLDEESLRRLHHAGFTVLERTGVEVRDERALAELARAGARIEGSRARIPAGLLDDAVADLLARCEPVLDDVVTARLDEFWQVP